MPIFNAPFSTSVFMPPFWVTSETVSVQENNTTVTTLDAGYVTQYSVVGGVDASKFSITGNTLSFTSAPDFEAPTDSGTNNIYDVTVRATNPAGFADRSIAVTVTNDISDDEAIIINGTTHYLTSSDYIVGTGTDRQGTRTGSLIAMTVPATVTVRIDMWGGGGGPGWENGGAAGYARGRITLQPNTNYRLLVAGGGSGGGTNAVDGGYGGGGAGGPSRDSSTTAGYNLLQSKNPGASGSAYGNGGAGSYYGDYPSRQGGGGGGCSGLFLGTGTSTPLLIAGGGGGSSGRSTLSQDGSTAGYPNGYVGPANNGDIRSGGTQTSGGSGGVSTGDYSGADGASGRGGGGGQYAASFSVGTGGGGGGGYYGGGGGTATAVAGGGGSSYFNSSYIGSTGRYLSAENGDSRTPYTSGSVNYSSSRAGEGGAGSSRNGYGGRISISLP